MYKLVTIDMDGTLLNSNGEISQENVKAIKKATEKGVKVVIATGRGIKSLGKFIDQLGFGNKEGYVITNNGVSLHSTKTLECLKSNIIEGEELKKLCGFGLELGAFLHVYDYSGSCIVLEDNEFTRFEKDHVRIPTIIDPNFYKNMDKNNKAFKVLYLSNEKKIEEIYNKIPESMKEKYTVVKSLPFVIEVFDKKCNKGNAVKDLCKIFNITTEEVISIGDQNNDYEMIKYAGLGVAMGNAVDSLKNIAKYVTDTNDNNGVAKVINKFILQE